MADDTRRLLDVAGWPNLENTTGQYYYHPLGGGGGGKGEREGWKATLNPKPETLEP